jgi:hypothetical protein
MMFLEGQLQHERKKMAAELTERDALINQIQRKFEAQEKMIELMQRQCEKETRLRSLMTYRQARPHVEKRGDDDAQRMSRQDRARSSVRHRRARSASITRHHATSSSATKTSSEASTNAIVITRERRARLKIDQKDVSDDSGANLSPDITDSDTSIKQQSVKSDEKTTKQVRKTRSNNLSSRKLLEIGITI